MGIQVLELRSGGAPAPAGPASGATQADLQGPLVRASRAWTALKVSPVLESLAFLARGVDCGRAPRGAACPEHVLGPLVGTIVGPVGGRQPRDCVEEFFQRAAAERGVTLGEWFQWRRARYSAHLLEDVTMLAHRGSCLAPGDLVRCTCRGMPKPGEPIVPSAWTHHFEPVLGPVPALTPDPTGQTDPWQDTLVLLASTFRGRGSPMGSLYSSSGPPAIKDMRTLAAHLDRLAGAFAGPRRADRMSGLARVQWEPRLPITGAWRERDRAGGTGPARAELHARLLRAVGL